MSVILPKEIAYSPVLPTLPSETQLTSVVLRPSTGSGTYTEGGVIQFDLPARGFVDPNSIYIRYKYNIAIATAATSIRGTPLYTPFSRLTTSFASQQVENIANYGQVQNMILNCKMNPAQKAGMASALGLIDTASTATFANLNGRALTAATHSISMAGPLNCILSNCEKLVPLFAMPNVRIELTVDTLANMLQSSANASGFSLSNIELCFDVIDFGAGVEEMVKHMGNPVYLKSCSWSNIGVPLASGQQGQIELVYNQRLSSIRSLFSLFTPTSAGNHVNGLYDSIDMTSGNGDYSYTIAGVVYPPLPISTKNSSSAILMELQGAWGGVHSTATNNMSITNSEFSLGLAGNPTTTAAVPAKFIFAQNVEKLSSNGALLTGISTQNSAVSLRVNTGTATPLSYNAQLIALYDVLIEIDTVQKGATVKQ